MISRRRQKGGLTVTRVGMQTPYTVVIQRCSSYEERDVEKAVASCFESSGFRLPGHDTKVLVKPNLLVPALPDRAVTTRAEIVKAVLRVLRDCTPHVVAGDSPGFGTCRQAAEVAGVAHVCRQLGVRLGLFNRTATLHNPRGVVCRRFEVASEVVEADLVVNLPKLKTHGLTGLTCAVKNLFGCVPGLGKQRLHLRMQEAEAFSAMLVDLCDAVRPAFNLVDAVVAMEGNGPRHGDPRNAGLIIAGTDPYAVDLVACETLGIDPRSVTTVAAARRRGLGPQSAAEIEIMGLGVEEAQVRGFKRPRPRQEIPVPSTLRSVLRDCLTARPEVLVEKCRKCLVCRQVCPAGAISESGENPRIDYSRCIRCYCCDEMCPHGAITMRRPVLSRFFRQK